MKIVRNCKKVNASAQLSFDGEWEDLTFDEQVAVMRDFVRDYDGTRVFEDFADQIGVDVFDVIDTFCDAEAHGDIVIPRRAQKDSEYANDDIYGSDMDERAEFRHTKTGKVYSLSQLKHLFKFKETRGYEGSFNDWLDEQVASNKLVQAAASVEGADLPGIGDYDPPEQDEPVDIEDVVDYINVQLDADIVTDNQGSWEYVDDSYPWACSDSGQDNWYSAESGLYLDDCIGVVEKVDDLMADMLPNEPGTYHVSGNVNLYYLTTGLSEYRDYYQDEDGNASYDSTLVTDNADVYYVEEHSTLDNFDCYLV